MQSEISARFHALADIPENQTGLAEGALVLAAEVRPEIEIDQQLSLIDELVERIRPLVDATSTFRDGVAALNHSFFELEGFRGNKDRYDDPRNSFLDEVLTSRRGLPITLSVLYVEVARRIGFEAYGVGFPGHFLSKIVGTSAAPHDEIIVDPFFARVLRQEDCVDRLSAALGETDPDPREWLRSVTAKETFVRMLNNLKILYIRSGDALSALGCFDRILVLSPNSALEFRDRGFLLERLDCTRAAIADYSRFLELGHDHAEAAAIRRRRDALAQKKPLLN